MNKPNEVKPVKLEAHCTSSDCPERTGGVCRHQKEYDESIKPVTNECGEDHIFRGINLCCASRVCLGHKDTKKELEAEIHKAEQKVRDEEKAKFEKEWSFRESAIIAGANSCAMQKLTLWKYEVKEMRYGDINPKFNGIGLTLKERILVRPYLRQIRSNTIDELLTKLNERKN